MALQKMSSGLFETMAKESQNLKSCMLSMLVLIRRASFVGDGCMKNMDYLKHISFLLVQFRQIL
jgi:hypothetical protein